MSDEYETEYGFDPFNSNDALLDTDQDGITNLEEYRNQSNPLADDYAPIISTPQTMDLYAEHIFTELTLDQLRQFSQLVANDGKDGLNCCEVKPVGLKNDVMVLPSGRNTILWRTQDEAGNIGTAEQTINIYPMVNIELQQQTAEGNEVNIPVYLSGESPHYPVVIPFDISGSVDSLDYQLFTNEVVIEQGTKGFVTLAVNQDYQTESDETLIVTLDNNVNLGAQISHTLTISDQNIVPKVGIDIYQQQKVTTIAKDSGEVSIKLNIEDPNLTDQHLISWTIPDYANAQVNANQKTVILNPDNIELPEENHGLLSLSVLVTDSGSGELSQQRTVDIPIVVSYPLLETTDTDNDGLTDLEEGL